MLPRGRLCGLAKLKRHLGYAQAVALLQRRFRWRRALHAIRRLVSHFSLSQTVATGCVDALAFVIAFTPAIVLHVFILPFPNDSKREFKRFYQMHKHMVRSGVNNGIFLSRQGSKCNFGSHDVPNIKHISQCLISHLHTLSLVPTISVTVWTGRQAGSRFA